MRIERTKNAGRNVAVGFIQKIYQIVMPFIMRTIMIYFMGIEYAGLNNLFVSILQVLNLSELGVGAAMICSMYAPIAEDDTAKICALMNLYKKAFRIIGLVILGFGLLIVPVLPKLISGEIPDTLNLYILYLLYLGNTVLSYWLYAYKNSLLYAHQRLDVSSKVLLFTSSFQYVFQIIVLIVFHNYYLYVVASITAQVLSNVLTAIRVDKMYPNYRPKGQVDQETYDEIKKKIQGLVTNKIGSTILKSADSIVISAFLGLSILAIYQNYYFILSSVISIVYIIYQSTIAGIGNSLLVENQSKNYNDFNTMTFAISWLSAVCCCCFIALYQPFMKIWMGDKYLLDYSVIICLVVYFFVFEIDQLIGAFKDAAGIWYEDRYRPLVTAIVNLILNLIMVQFIGLYGVLLSTVISLLAVGIPWMIHNVFSLLFTEQSWMKYYISLAKYSIVTVVAGVLTYCVCIRINDVGIVTLIIKGVIAVIIPIAIFIPIYHKNSHFKRVTLIARRMLLHKRR